MQEGAGAMAGCGDSPSNSAEFGKMNQTTTTGQMPLSCTCLLPLKGLGAADE